MAALCGSKSKNSIIFNSSSGNNSPPARHTALRTPVYYSNGLE
jgi:hypothetical protein